MTAVRHILYVVTAVTAMVAPASASSVAAPDRSPVTEASIAALVDEAAHRFAIPQAWIYAVMRVESGGDPRALSPKGAVGLMQIMPATWASLRTRYGLGGDVYDARDNIMAGAAYLREMYDRYGSPGFLAAYNAGPGRYEDHLSNGRPLPAETVAYVDKLAPVIDGASAGQAVLASPDPLAWTRASLFAGRAQVPRASADDAVAAMSNASTRVPSDAAVAAGTSKRAGLFVPLSGQASR